MIPCRIFYTTATPTKKIICNTDVFLLKRFQQFLYTLCKAPEIPLYLIAIVLLTACNTMPKEKQHHTLVTVFEERNGKETPEYTAIIDFYKKLALQYPQIALQSVGETDSGIPLHIATFNTDKTFHFKTLQKEKVIILINNGIHPGESDGIDATMLFFRDLAEQKIDIPKEVIIVTIPVYNIGGALNRNTTTRANQNGPEAYGFRGNARNYDLNRDFIKSDTKNTLAFATIFHMVNPDIFIDNHVSNGADYQYTLTHLFTQHNKLGDPLGNYLHTRFMPDLESDLARKNWDITPYVNVFDRVPDHGFSQFIDHPRYSTGYTTLWNTLGVMIETHMLKPYKKRVKGTYEFIKSITTLAEHQGSRIKALRVASHIAFTTADTYPLHWEIDTTKATIRSFKGYEGTYTTGKVTGIPGLHYNTDNPFTKQIRYQDYYKPTREIVIPQAYIIPSGWWNVINLLKANKVTMKTLKKDTIINVEAYHIEAYQTRTYSYEGHYPHYNTIVSASEKAIAFKKGDYIINVNQPAFRYLIETLEPEATDSFFNWNFFDTILQRKEGFSPYVFEDLAQEMLKKDTLLNTEFKAKKVQDNTFSDNRYAQLNWLYQRSVYYEKAHLRYPIYRILKPQ